MRGTQEIIQDAESLPVEERVKIVDSLLRSLNPPDPVMDHLWLQTAQRRLAELRSGMVEAVPGEVVMARLRNRTSGT
jgi:putative addiction module component (TIGR02574 family)